MLKGQIIVIMCVIMLIFVGCEKKIINTNVGEDINKSNSDIDNLSPSNVGVDVINEVSPDSNMSFLEKIDKTQWNLVYVDEENPLPNEYKINTKEIPIEYIINQNARLIDERIYDPLIDMLEAAKSETGLRICITSAYRDIEYQTGLFNAKVQENLDTGLTQEEAEKHAKEYVALPGTSEHNTGLTVDLVSIDWYDFNEELNDTFEKTEEAKWLFENANKYGFIVSFPKEKLHITGVSYEPWHYRYVGVEHATRIKDRGYCLKEYLYYF